MNPFDPEVDAFINANPHVLDEIESILPNDQSLSSFQIEVDLPFNNDDFLYTQSCSQDFTYNNLTSLVYASHHPCKDLSSYSSPSPYSLSHQYISSPEQEMFSSIDPLTTKISTTTNSLCNFEVPSSTNFSIDGYRTKEQSDLFIEQREFYTSNSDSLSSYCNSSSQNISQSPFSSTRASSVVPKIEDHEFNHIIPHNLHGDQQTRNVYHTMLTQKEWSKRKKMINTKSKKCINSLKTGSSSSFGTHNSLFIQDNSYSDIQDFAVNTMLPVQSSTYNTLTSSGIGTYKDLSSQSSSPYSSGSQNLSSPLCDDTSSLDSLLSKMSTSSISMCDFEVTPSTNNSEDRYNRSYNSYIGSTGLYSSEPDSDCFSNCSTPSQNNRLSPFSPKSESTSAPSDVDYETGYNIPRNPRGALRRKNISHRTLTSEGQNQRKKTINNDASKRYRQRKTNSVQQIQQEESYLLARQTELKSTFEDLKRQKEELISSLNGNHNH